MIVNVSAARETARARLLRFPPMSLQSHYSPVAQAMEQNPLRPSWTMQRPGLISLAYGFPDSQSFPYDELAEATAGLMAAHNAEALQYGPVSGPEPLRSFLADWVGTTEGLDVGPDNIMITSGASQGIALAARLLVPPGGTVIVESPTFIGALWFFRGLGINVVGVDTDNLGIVPSALRETVTQQRQAGAHVSLVYTMPTVHNPVGFNAPVERRRELAEVGEELDLVFLEDDAYGDLIFDGDRPPALYAIAGRERVIKLGTLSKLVAGGMRLGWAVAEPDDISRMCGLKADSATGPFAAWVTGAYLQSGALARRLPTLLDLYRTRRDVMLEELAPLSDVGCDWITPVGGFFIWLELPEGADSEAIRERAEEKAASPTWPATTASPTAKTAATSASPTATSPKTNSAKAPAASSKPSAPNSRLPVRSSASLSLSLTETSA